MARDWAAAALLALLAACDWDDAAWLAARACDDAARLAARAWDDAAWLAARACDDAAWLAAWICDGIACPETRGAGLVGWRAGPAPRGGITGPIPYP